MIVSSQGFLVDWDAQKAIWDGMFSKEVLGVRKKRISMSHSPQQHRR